MPYTGVQGKTIGALGGGNQSSVKGDQKGQTGKQTAKKSQHSTTPDVHPPQTYNERTCLGGINGIMAGSNSVMSNKNNYGMTQNSKQKNQQPMVGMTMSTIQTGNTGGATIPAGPRTNSNVGIYGGNQNELDEFLQSAQFNRAQANATTPLDLHDLGDDIIMMNIPREGVADQLNKSSKLTLSSKKQYENHLQGLKIDQNLNNSISVGVVGGQSRPGG